jgi:CubicO group peptidase (beta-lactamase class C family)
VSDRTNVLTPLAVEPSALSCSSRTLAGRFWVPTEKHGRIAQSLPGEASLRAVTSEPAFDSGGGGAVSTAIDYARFSQMLLGRGRIDGVTVLSRKTVELMTADHLGTISHGSLAPGYGFGLGFAVRKADGLASEPGSVGEYYWLGANGTSFFVDPKEEIVAIWLAQHSGFPKLFHYRRTFKNLVMQAIVD